MADDKFNRDIAALNDNAKRRFEHWENVSVPALGRAVGENGIPEAQMRQIMDTGNGEQILETAAREQLMKEADDGNKESEFAYREIRQAEREQWRKMKGRY
jgi:hypothetical protein